MILTTGGLIEIADYNDLALEVNRLFSDNTISLVWSTSNLVLNDTASAGGEIAGATRILSPSPLSTDFITVTVDDITLDVAADYTVSYLNPVTITFLDPLASNAVLKVFNRQDHRFGWGQQASVYPIIEGDPVLADEATLQAYLEANVNNLIDKTNIMETHIAGPSTLTRIAPGALIYAADKITISNTIATDVTAGDNYWKNEAGTAFGNVDQFTRISNWDNILVGEMRHYWNGYDSFRYFFNSGNELRANVSMTGNPTNQGFNNWSQVVTAMGTLSINYDTCFQSGRNGITTNLGAFDLTGTYQTIFTSGSPEVPVDSDGNFDAYGTYNSLVMIWEARIVENVPSSGDIALDIRITMNDQNLNTTTIGTTIYSGGYLLADDLTDNSAAFSMTTNSSTLSILNDFESTSTATITNITQDDPGVVTIGDTSVLTNGSMVSITGVVGMTQVNDLDFTINILNGTTFDLVGINSIGYTAYISGGTLTYQTDDN